jgi:hypothetical protein
VPVRALQRSQCLLRRRQEGLARRRRQGAAPMAAKQLCADLGLQQRHALAHLRLRPATPRRRLAETAAGHDIEQQLQVIHRNRHKQSG